MAKMAHAGKHHGQTRLLGGGYELILTNGAAGLINRNRPGRSGL
jgi:hypothetical protein